MSDTIIIFLLRSCFWKDLFIVLNIKLTIISIGEGLATDPRTGHVLLVCHTKTLLNKLYMISWVFALYPLNIFLILLRYIRTILHWKLVFIIWLGSCSFLAASLVKIKIMSWSTPIVLLSSDIVTRVVLATWTELFLGMGWSVAFSYFKSWLPQI